jgi:AcrR family transcriptional regulator
MRRQSFTKSLLLRSDMSRSAEARNKALTAATVLLRARGIPGFTIEEVAKTSGVAKTTIYRHWPTADQLLAEAVSCQIAPLPTPNTGSLEGDLRAFFSSVVPPESLDTLAQMLTGVLYAAAHDPAIKAALEESIRQRTIPIKTIVELAQARGEVPAHVNPERAVDLVEGPFLFAVLTRRLTFQPSDIDELLRLIVAGLTGVR